MKRRISKLTSGGALMALAALTVALAFGISGTARAGGESQVCGPQTLQGSYVFTARGFNIVSGVAQPKAIVEGIDFNGDGTLAVPFATLSVNGVIIVTPPGGVGTYTVETNCQGTLTFTNGPTYNIFASSNGRQVSMIQTTANTVFQGTASKASR